MLRKTFSVLCRSRLLLHPSVCQPFCDMTPGVESPAKRQKMEVDGMGDAVVEPVLQFKRLNDAFAPVRGSDHAAGFDLFSNKDMVVPAKDKASVPTDLQIALPKGCYGRIAPRSGLALKKFIDVGAGVIDRDYRGEVFVLLFNFSDTNFEVKRGDRIAQLICEKIFMPTLVERETLEETKRGEGGFGSTGTN
ncbi:probable deoxyuridine 5'-triphosphate nucleotidohydrolase [Strongylocentrotus purpuratus]|uniref:Deoxyuridine 5'-triphosphate nucleotidohydrolase n=1 Tax=Strongylocentrotus purpuratus TaxID=7668 RepID=A0A7M7NWA4_STRPU|nr:probable deoxyuridine 5'-triphosphate nucleotidohydrolase [Strongylocentrotus purpuratus]